MNDLDSIICKSILKGMSLDLFHKAINEVLEEFPDIDSSLDDVSDDFRNRLIEVFSKKLIDKFLG
jgi:hypothetical protein